MPGGFIDYGEAPEIAVLRELQEETCLVGSSPRLINVYGNPERDPRRHTVSVVYEVKVDNFETLKAADDAEEVHEVPLEDIEAGKVKLAFDHAQMIADFLKREKEERTQ